MQHGDTHRVVYNKYNVARAPVLRKLRLLHDIPRRQFDYLLHFASHVRQAHRRRHSVRLETADGNRPKQALLCRRVWSGRTSGAMRSRRLPGCQILRQFRYRSIAVNLANVPFPFLSLIQRRPLHGAFHLRTTTCGACTLDGDARAVHTAAASKSAMCPMVYRGRRTWIVRPPSRVLDNSSTARCASSSSAKCTKP